MREIAVWKEAQNVLRRCDVVPHARGFSCHDFTFRERVSALVFTTAVWKSRVPLLLVAEAGKLQRGQTL